MNPYDDGIGMDEFVDWLDRPSRRWVLDSADR